MTKLKSAALAVGALALVACAAPMASAAPFSGMAVTTGGSAVEPVHYRRKHSHHRHYRDGTVVDAPLAHVDTRGRRTWVDAPFTAVRVHRRGVWVRAPFVDIYVPR